MLTRLVLLKKITSFLKVRCGEVRCEYCNIVINLFEAFVKHIFGHSHQLSSTKLVSRHIPSAPTRILDAPDLMDDYYLNLLSWSDTNVLAVALEQTVYLWNAETGQIDELCNVEDEGPDAHISSVSWIQEGGGHLAVGTSWVS